MKQTQALQGLREWALSMEYLRDGGPTGEAYWRLRSWSVEVRHQPPGNLRRGIVLDQGITLLRELLATAALDGHVVSDLAEIELDLRSYEAAVIQWKQPPAAHRPTTQHGSYSCYLNNACRRDECRAAWATYMREWRATARQEAQERRSEALYRTKQRLGVSHG